MREIKFRGKDKAGIWRHGYYFCVNTFSQTFDVYHYIRSFNRGDHRILPETLGQYAGLKDKNGVEIYEGDILRDDEAHYVIFWQNEISGFDLRRLEDGEDMRGFGCYDNTIVYDMCAESKVIGNIHQNPELLK